MYQEIAVPSGRIHTVLYPAGMVHRDGSVTKFAGSKHDPRVLFSSSFEVLPSSEFAKEVKCIIAEPSPYAGEADIEHILNWSDQHGVESLIFVETDPYSDRYNYYRKREIPCWGWDPTALQTDYQYETHRYPGSFKDLEKTCRWETQLRLANLVESIERLVLIVQHSELDDRLQEIPQIAESLGRIADNNHDKTLALGVGLLNSAYYTMCRVLAPLPLLEKQLKSAYPFVTIERRLRRLRGFTNAVDGSDAVRSSLSRVASLLEESYQYLSECVPPKAQSIVQCVKTAQLKKNTLLVVTPNRGTKHALERHLIEELDVGLGELRNDYGTKVRVQSELASSGFFDVCLFYGMIPYSRLNLLRSAVAPRIAFLAHTVEVDSIKSLLALEMSLLRSRFPYDSRARIVEELAGVSSEIVRKCIPAPGEEEIELNIQIGEETITIDSTKARTDFLVHGVLKGEDGQPAIDDAVFFDEIDEEGNVIEVEGGENITITAVRLDLEDGARIYLRGGSFVNVVQSRGFKIASIQAKDVRVNDILVVPDGGALRSLEEHTMRKLERDPRLFEAVVRSRSWVDVLNEGMQVKNHSFADVLEELRKRGSRITTAAAIYHWSRGRVIGPQDAANVARIGRIYENSYIEDNHQSITASINKIRRIHNQIKKKMERAILTRAFETPSQLERDPIDSKMNIYWEDFIQQLYFGKVIGIEGSNDVNVSLVGQLLEA